MMSGIYCRIIYGVVVSGGNTADETRLARVITAE